MLKASPILRLMKTLTLHLDGTSPDRLPMARLAEYLRELSTFLGSKDHVHFDAVAEGSVRLNTCIEDSKYLHVIHHAREASNGRGPKRAQRAYAGLVALMVADQVDGSLVSNDARILDFPTAKSNERPLVIKKRGSVQGRLYLVGGKDEIVPVRLEGAAGETFVCEVDIALAEQLGALLFKQIRLYGEGEWESRPTGGWRLRKLHAQSFDKLDPSSVSAGIQKLRQFTAGAWSDMDDPHGAIQDSRG